MLGFVDTKSRLRVNVLKPGDIALIPQGWWHFHMNIGKEACQSLSAFSSEEAGVIVTHSALLTVPDAVLRATTGVTLVNTRVSNDTATLYKMLFDGGSLSRTLSSLASDHHPVSSASALICPDPAFSRSDPARDRAKPQ
ncbi:hypothetical protein CBR_g28013 [Chara braunii]|uniref:Cupin type-1 domain-containing protein n=1 Tax=Chara braunii TaxID=69332 RepID=A0A388L8Z4_CHABU|nr:hypothetical protein CBR_g28013 [Chara braunii]|eukprot:GBG78790.1 hypothetical protein CBR_g28013 [Chara braunii]